MGASWTLCLSPCTLRCPILCLKTLSCSIGARAQSQSRSRITAQHVIYHILKSLPYAKHIGGTERCQCRKAITHNLCFLCSRERRSGCDNVPSLNCRQLDASVQTCLRLLSHGRPAQQLPHSATTGEWPCFRSPWPHAEPDLLSAANEKPGLSSSWQMRVRSTHYSILVHETTHRWRLLCSGCLSA